MELARSALQLEAENSLTVPKPVKWDGTSQEWQEVRCFFRGLRWVEDPDCVTSVCELVVLFHHQGRSFGDDPQLDTSFPQQHSSLGTLDVLKTS